MACNNLTSKDYKLIRSRINTANLTDAEIKTCVDLATSNDENITVDTLLSPSRIHLLNQEIANQRNLKAKEKRAIEKPMIGNAEMYISSKVEKSNVRNQPRTLFIFTDNLQAYNVFAAQKVEAEGLIDITDSEQITGLTNVTSSSALMRTNTAGERFPNSIGFVVKKNAVKGQKVRDFTNNDEDQFQDTPEDRKVFHDVNMTIIQQIKENLNGDQYDKVILPPTMASSRARLPKTLADDLVNMLREELGIQAQAIQIFPKGTQKWKGDWYSVEISQGDKASNNKNNKETKEDKKQKEAKESLKAERPILEEDIVTPNEEDRSILSKEFPDIAKRKARVDYLNTAFSQFLTNIIEKYKADLKNMSQDDKEATVIDEVNNLTLADVERGLNTGTVAQQRIYALTNLSQVKNDKLLPLSDYIFSQINDLMQYIVDLSQQEDGIEQIANLFLYPDSNVLTYYQDFQQEAIAYDWDEKKMKKMAYQRARYLAQQYAKMLKPEVFYALKQDMAFDLEFNENIKMNFMGRPVQTKDDEDDETLDESNVDANKEGYMIKYKLLNPAKTLSVRMKTLLASLYMTKYGKNGWSYVFDDLGGRVRMNPSVAYYILLDEFSTMTEPEDLDKILDSTVDKYPWIGAIIDKLRPNPENMDLYDEDTLNKMMDLKKEFYTTFRKSQVPYGMTNKNGSFVWLNHDAKSETFLDFMRKAYEGREVYGANPIYNEDGQCNEANVKKLNRLVTVTKKVVDGKFKDKIMGKPDKEDEVRKDHPLSWALSVLVNKSNRYHNIQNIVDAIKILKGEDKFHTKVSLEAALNNLGINTSNMNMESVLPYIDEEALETVEKTIKEYGNIEIDGKVFTSVLDYLCDKEDSIITPAHVKRIGQIISAIRTITNQSTGEKGGFHGNDPLVDKFEDAFLKIGQALTLASDGYTQATFRHGSTDRFTYAASDMIATMVNAIHSEDREKGTRYIQENFGRFDFFKNQATGEWMNTWMELLEYQDPNTKEYPYRDRFGFVNILSFEGSDKKNMIGNVSKEALIRGAINMYYSANDDSEGRKFAWYRCPLFSDVDAMVMLQHVRYTGERYQEEIVSKLAKVLQQEIDRINHLDSLNPSDLGIEFYNKNGKKFQFFPELNYKIDEILSTLSSFAQEGVKSINDNQQAYLEKLVAEVILGKYNSKTGEREEGKLQRFLDSFSDDEKLKLYRQITESEKKKAKENAKRGIAQEESFTIDDLLAETNDKEKISQAQLEEADRLLEEFYYNDFFAQSQIIQILGSDLAYYKNFRDFIKRNKQAYACGERLYARDEKGEPLMEHCLYGEDLDMVSNSWSMINTLLTSDSSMSEMEKAVLRGAINSFKGICSTDGQSLRTMKSFRKIFKAMGGRWTDAMEDAYNNIRNGHPSAEDFMALWHPIKPFVISYEAKMVNGRMEKVPVQHKNSEYMLNAIYTMFNVAMNKSPELLAIHQFMEDNDIDVFHFHSVIKEGYFGGVDINYDYDKFNKALSTQRNIFNKLKDGQELPDGISPEDELLLPNTKANTFAEYKKELDKALTENHSITQEQYNNELTKFRHTIKNNPSVEDIRKSSAYKALQNQAGARNELGEVIKNDDDFTTQLHEDYDHVIPLDDYMVVQPSDDHLTDAVALFGSQLRNIIPADLPAEFTLDVTINGKTNTLNREQAIKYYNTIITDQLLDSFQQVDKEFSSIEKLQAALFAKMDNNPKYGPDVKAALELTEDKKAFKMPLNSPNLTNKIEELILSTFKNAIQKQRIRGGNVVLVSNYGLSDTLHVHWKNTKTGKSIESDEELAKTPKEELAIDYIPCYMPFDKAEEYKDFLIPQPDGSFLLDIKKAENTCPRMLEVLGYRIPTEDKYSAMPMKIIGFMPACSGTTIMLPSDIVTMSGTDFDIDKLFLMIRSTRRETYKSDLRQAYVDWINAKNTTDESIIEQLASSGQFIVKKAKNAEEEEKEIKELISDPNIFRKLGRSRFGLTDQEIASMRAESDLFDQFMIEEGYNYTHKTPHYIVKTPKNRYNEDGSLNLDAMSERATADERNNMLIDTIWGVLTSNAGSALSMLPGSFANVKHASRMQRIIHDKNALKHYTEKYKEDLKTIGLYTALTGYIEEDGHLVNRHKDGSIVSSDEVREFLDSVYDKYATIQSPMDILDYADNHRNLMDGNDLIGMFAVNSSNHYKFQFLGLKLKKEFEFRISGVQEPITLIDSVNSPITGVRIGRMCAEFQAASPDNGKDPCLGDLNANSNTVSRISFLLRIGMDAQTIGMINTSQELVNLGDSLGSDTSLKLKGTNINNFELDINKVTQYYADLMLLGKDEFRDKYDYADFQYIKDYAEWMEHIDKIAKSLNSASCISRSDSANGAMAVSMAEATKQRLKAEDFIKESKEPDFPIEGLDKLVDEELDATHYILDKKNSANQKAEFRKKLLDAKIPRLQAAYTLGHKSAHSLVKKWLVQMDDNVYNLVKELRDQTKQTLTWERDIKTLRAFYTELTMYTLSKDSIFSTDTDGKTLMEKRNYYIHDFPMKLKMFLEEKNPDGTFKHQKIRDLNIVKRLSNLDKRGIKFQNVGKVTPMSRKHYVEELESMLYMGPDEAKLALDLFMYAYYDTGLSFRHNSYGIFFTTTFMRAMPRYVNKLRDANSRLLSDPDFASDFVNQFMLNHPDIIPTLKVGNFTQVDSNTIRILKTSDKGLPTAVLAGIDSLAGLCKFIKIGNDVYALTSDNDLDNVMYTKMDRLPEDTLYYDANSSYADIEYDKLEGRGSISKIESKKENKKDSKKEVKEGEVPTEGKKEVEIGEVQNEKEVSTVEAPTEGAEVNPEITPTDGPNDEDLQKHADALDAVEFIAKQKAERLKAMALAEQSSQSASEITPTERTKENPTPLSDMNDGPTIFCPVKNL